VADDTSMTGDGVRWTEIDGVRTVWGEAPGPLAASLVFRVGAADETLTTFGSTHIVEHLTLFPLGQQPHYQNGSVRVTLTSFDTSGEPAEVTAFLRGVCENLSSLAIDRLPDEIRVLETEESRRSLGTATSLLSWRFGPNGPGLWGYDQYARRVMDGPHLQLWADRVFTRGNAVLVLTGPPPEGLSLPLKDGPRRATPPLVDAIQQLPSWFQSPWSDVGAHSLLTRSVPAAAYAHVLGRELVDTLRYRLGVAYSPSVDYDPYDATTAQLYVGADAHSDHSQAVLDTLVETLDRLAQDGPDQSRVDEYVAQFARSRALPGAAAGEAHRQAVEWLFSGEVRPPELLEQELADLTVDSVRGAAEEARSQALYCLPEGVEPTTAAIVRSPDVSVARPVTGTVHRWLGQHTGGSETVELVVSDTGVTLRRPEGEPVTVMFADARAVLVFPDGGRRLHAWDGVAITVEPQMWTDGYSVIPRIDVATAAIRVPMPERQADDIPQPLRTEKGSGSGKDMTRFGRIWRIVLGALLVVAAVGGAIVRMVEGQAPAGGSAIFGAAGFYLLFSGIRG